MKLRQQWLSMLLLVIMMLFKVCAIVTLYLIHEAPAKLMEVEQEHEPTHERMSSTSKKQRKSPCR